MHRGGEQNILIARKAQPKEKLSKLPSRRRVRKEREGPGRPPSLKGRKFQKCIGVEAAGCIYSAVPGCAFNHATNS